MSAKNIRACERCRQHKSRCLPGSSVNTCAGCEYSKTRCIPHIPIRRGAKAHRTIEELSRQVAALQLALQEQSKFISPAVQLIQDDLSGVSMSILGSVISAELLSAGVSRNVAPDIWMMNIESLTSILERYNEMASPLPFAILADVSEPSVTTAALPIFNLAALLVSPQLESEIATQLEVTFHRVLADQAMVKGKQNLDILSGLVTYLLWFHHHYDPETQQFFQYLQLAKAMVEDLQIGNCLKSNMNTISGFSRTSVARILAGLYYVDWGTSKLDTTRQRQLLSIENVRKATAIINKSMERSCDVHASRLLDKLSEGPCTLHCDELSGETVSYRCVCYEIIDLFSAVWISLEKIEAVSTLSRQNSDCVIAAEHLKRFIGYLCQQPPSYLQTMTIVEWAYLLTVLVKLPHLEGCAPEQLSGLTSLIIAKTRAHLEAGQRENLAFFEQSKHLWWLEGVLADALSLTSVPQDLSVSLRLMTTSVYELLEQLTERLCGFRKGIKIEIKAGDPQQTHVNSQDATFDQILARWVNIDQM